MAKAGSKANLERVVEAYGVRLRLGASDADLLARVEELVPPGPKPCPTGSSDERFALLAKPGAGYRVVAAGQPDAIIPDLEMALGMLGSAVAFCLASRAPEQIFIHAGVVTHRGRAIVMPGPTFSGKTTLVHALVRAGAVYYSDEYAVLDENGLVHPYPSPLAIRGDDGIAVGEPVETLGGSRGERAATIALVAVAQYKPGARWEPRSLTAGGGVLALLDNALPLRERPEQTLLAIRRAVSGAKVLEGPRGDANEAAAALLEEAHASRVLSG